jgi:hypothetical protein
VSVRGCGDDHAHQLNLLLSDTSMQAAPTHPNICSSLPSVLNDKRMPCRRRQCRRISSRRCLLLDKMCLRAHTKSKCLGRKFSRLISPEPSYAMHQQHRLTPSPLHGPLLRISLHSLTQCVCLFVFLFSCWHVCSQTDHNDATWATCSRTADG